MKYSLILAAALTASAAHASFELALVCDVSGHDIDRYDAETGLYLGSFGANYLGTPTDISIDQASGVAYVADQASGRVAMFDYNTGLYYGSFAQQPGGMYWVSRLSDGSVLSGNYAGAQTYRVNSSGTLLQTINTSGLYVEGHTQTSDGTVWYMDGGGAVSKLYSGTVGSASVTNRYTVSGNSAFLSFIEARGNQIVAMEYSPSASKKVYSFTTSGTTVTSALSYTLSLASPEYAAGTAIGHGGVSYFATTTLNTSTMYVWTPGNNFTRSFAMSQTVYANGMALVVAPEPGSMIALALGSAALIRRRRR